MTQELPKVYEPKEVEAGAESLWQKGRFWHADPADSSKKGAYAIVIPPPNVTAALHLGHALNNTLQDILIRFKRMQGFNTLWMPGTDHAGIATQTVVEKQLLAETGKRRTDFGRDEFIAHVQSWKDQYEARILQQLKSMGCSCDWERTRFTMDQTCARAVREVFFKLFADGLIYRGKRLVNWDPATQTVLADDEVEHHSLQGSFWYLKYPLVDPVDVCGTAFQAVDDAHSANTGRMPVPHTDDAVRKRRGAYLPHWTKRGSTYAVTFRLTDSLPAEAMARWRVERERVLRQAETQNRELTQHEQEEIARLYCERIEFYLDAGHGRCALRDPHVAEVVVNALKYFDGQRYDLVAWAVMPNHVHVILRPIAGMELSDILHSWKSYTANKANQVLGQTGEFWQPEYYDHLIRNEKDFFHQVNYVLENPAGAGLRDWPWVGVATKNGTQDVCGTAFQTVNDAQAADTGRMPVPHMIEHITVATTRPETMLGDTAVAINPADPRAKHLVGKMVRLPIVGRLIPIIADEHVVLPDAESDDEKAKFSTGFLKVTPAHDHDDYAIGQRHNLPIINILAPDGSISDKFGWLDWDSIKNPDVENLIGLDRFEAREAVVEWFRQENLLAEIRPYAHDVGHSYRSHVPIEPYLSDQWYIAVKKPIEHLADKFGTGLIVGTDVPLNSLAGLALKPLLDGGLRFVPQRYASTYQIWLENLRDWPISRQLWWGHRIPVWSSETPLKDIDRGKVCVHQFQNERGDMIYYVCVAPNCPEIEQSLQQQGFVQDPDVLDTWFSSALWPFSTLGWPDESPLLKTFYPTDLLCTAREIITLWVSRMVMMGQYCLGQIPFHDVYIHAMIQDGRGRKMSKSLGNGIDPLTAIDSHGADAMRFTLASMTTDTQDVRMPVAELTLPDGRVVNSSPKFDVGRNFCNKLWNASRFAMMNLQGTNPTAFDPAGMDITDRWILSGLNDTIREVTEGFADFKFNEPLHTISRFFWNDFCDWYLEWCKPRMQDDAQKPIAQNVLAFALDHILRLLHPFIPFITEGIFQNLNSIAPIRGLKGLCQLKTSEALMTAVWPEKLTFTENDEYTQNVSISLIQNVIRNTREIRSQYSIHPSMRLDVLVNVSAMDSEPVINLLNKNAKLICLLGTLKSFLASDDIKKPKGAAVAVLESGMTEYILNVIDPQAERARLLKQKQFLLDGITPLQKKLANEAFLTNAKPQVVGQARDKLKELTDQLAAVEKLLAELEQ